VPPKSLARKIVESVVVGGAGVALMALGTFGAFTDATPRFPPAAAGDGH
jgi:hypothetical protein